MKRLIIGAMIALLCGSVQAFAAEKEEDDANTVGSIDEAFDLLRKEQRPDEPAFSVEDAIKKFFPDDADVDEGSYPLSEASEHNFDLRRSKPEQPSYSGRIFGRYSSDDISGVDKWEKELELNLAYKDWDAYFRFSDFNTFAKANDPFKWEKGKLRFRHDEGKVTLGSIGALFGRGLAVNIYEDRSVDFDNEVEGIKVEQNLGEARLTALSGGRKLKGEVAESTIDAAEIVTPIGDDVELGLHAAAIEFPDLSFTPDAPNKLDYDVTGADVSARLGDLKLYGELVRIDRDATPFGQNLYDFEGLTGKGSYFSATFSGDGYSVLVERKDYQGLLQPFSVLPPLKKFWEQSTAEPDDDKGYATQVLLSPFDDDSQVSLYYGQGNGHDVKVPYTEFIATYTSPTGPRTTYTGEYWHMNYFGTKRDVQRLTLNHRVDESWTAGTFLEREKVATSADSFIDYITEVELAFESKFNLVFTRESSGADTEGQSTWRVWEVRYRPDENQEINLVAGSRRAGFVCSGGVCRPEPAFDGMKIDYLIKF